MKKSSLPPRQAVCLEVFNRLSLQKGRAPTMREISDGMGISKKSVFKHVRGLIRRGHLVNKAKTGGSLTAT